MGKSVLIRELESAGVPDHYRVLAREIAQGTTIEAASRSACMTYDAAWRALQLPAMQLAIRRELAHRIATEGASVGFKALHSIAGDLKAPAAARVTAGRALLAMAGFSEKAGEERRTEKPLNEMTGEELRVFIDKHESEINKLEGELAARATPVNAPVPPLLEHDSVDMFE